jgi:hypothetical protein
VIFLLIPLPLDKAPIVAVVVLVVALVILIVAVVTLVVVVVILVVALVVLEVARRVNLTYRRKVSSIIFAP